jgi:hypothetical protein
VFQACHVAWIFGDYGNLYLRRAGIQKKVGPQPSLYPSKRRPEEAPCYTTWLCCNVSLGGEVFGEREDGTSAQGKSSSTSLTWKRATPA